MEAAARDWRTRSAASCAALDGRRISGLPIWGEDGRQNGKPLLFTIRNTDPEGLPNVWRQNQHPWMPIRAGGFPQAVFSAVTEHPEKADSFRFECLSEAERHHQPSPHPRAINVDFNGNSGSNGTIASGETARIAGIPLYSSNHVVQPAYTLVAGDYNTDYAQDLSKCRGLIFHRDAVGVVSLLSPSLQLTGDEFRVQYQYLHN